MKKMHSKKSLLVVIMILAMSLVFFGCNKEPSGNSADNEASEEKSETEESQSKEEEKQEESGEDEEEKQDEPEMESQDNHESSQARKAAYVKVLRDLTENLILPDGRQPEEPNPMNGEIPENSFAVYDVDGDGKEELVINYTTASMAGMFENVYGYDEPTGTLVLEMSTFPATEYYEDGFVICNSSHNHSLSAFFWPYTLLKYDGNTGVYEQVAYVSGWEKEFYPTNYDEVPFPDEYDKDEDGVLYYIDLVEDKDEIIPVDEEEMKAWFDATLAGAGHLALDYYKLTPYNISLYENSDESALIFDPAENEAIKFKEATLYIPKKYMDKIEIVEGEDSLTIYHKRSKEIYNEVYGYDGGRICEVTAHVHSEGYSNLPKYTRIGSTGNATYILNLPTDVQFATMAEYDEAVKKGVDVTKEEVEKIPDEYGEIMEALRDLHPKFDMW